PLLQHRTPPPRRSRERFPPGALPPDARSRSPELPPDYPGRPRPPSPGLVAYHDEVLDDQAEAVTATVEGPHQLAYRSSQRLPPSLCSETTLRHLERPEVRLEEPDSVLE